MFSRFGRFLFAIPVIAVCGGGLIATAGLFVWVGQWEAGVVQANFSRQALAASQTIQQNLEGAVVDLHVVGDLFNARNGSVNREEFKLFTTSLLSRSPFVKGYAFHRIVKEKERAKFEAERSQEFPGFQIRQIRDGKPEIATSRPFYRVIDYIEPFDLHKRALGHDAHVVGRMTASAALEAAATGQPRVTPLLALPYIDRYGFLIFMPLFRAGSSADTVEADRLYGYAVAIFAVGESVEKSMSVSGAASYLDVKLFGKDSSGWVVAYDSPPQRPAHRDAAPLLAHLYDTSDLQFAKDFDVLNAPWRLRLSKPRPPVVEEHIGSLLTLLVGLVVTFSLSFYAWALLSNSRRVVKLVQQRTDELNRANGMLLDDVAAREAQNRILHHISAGALLTDIFDEILQFSEQQLPNARCMIFLAGDSSVRGPSLPQTFLDATAAHGAQLSAALDRELRWSTLTSAAELPPGVLLPDSWVRLLAAHGITSVSTWPMHGKAGDVLGAFLVLRQTLTPTIESEADRELVNTSTNLIGIVIESRRAEDHVRHLAHHDEMTGLPNRSLFTQHLEKALAQAERSGLPVAVLFLDLDRFKNINDSFGHDAGDDLLRSISVSFRSCLRNQDSIARIGGDEFLIMLEDYTDGRHLAEVAERLLLEASQPFEIAGQECHLSASIGIATYPGDGRDVQALMKNADIAMYRAKSIGRNNYQFYSSEMNTHTLNRLMLESGLRRALERQEIVVHYQPKINLKSGCIVGLEALVRWQHSERGLIMPADFIPFAEEIGLISTIGLRVLRSACTDVARFRAAGIEFGRVAINLSGMQFNDAYLVADVRDAIAGAGIDPTTLEFEITESMVMQNRDRAIELMQGIRDLGITLSIDDFGTGYSSLASLKRFPVHSVKIDRSFIVDIPNDTNDVAIVSAIIAMAHSLGLKVIAEGVETAAQLEILGEFACDEYQGYLYSVPLSADDLIELLCRNEVPALFS